jgi:hypothetical protein
LYKINKFSSFELFILVGDLLDFLVANGVGILIIGASSSYSAIKFTK